MKSYKEIIETIIKKDPRGLEDLYDAYGKKFYAFAINKWELSEDDAWDVVYKTLETLVLKLSDYHFESQMYFDGFLYKVLLNFLKQHFRSKRIQQEKSIIYTNIDEEEETTSEVKNSINKESFDAYYQTERFDSPALITLKSVLERMDETDRDILLLRAQNYSYDEIAKFLSIDNNQLKVKHHRAKKKLIAAVNQLQKTSGHENEQY